MSDKLISLASFKPEAQIGLTFYRFPGNTPEVVVMVKFQDGSAGWMHKNGIGLKPGHALLDLIATLRAGERDQVVAAVHGLRSSPVGEGEEHSEMTDGSLSVLSAP